MGMDAHFMIIVSQVYFEIHILLGVGMAQTFINETA